MDFKALSLSKKYTVDTADGLGAVKGSPCIVKSIENTANGKKITLEWTGTSGTKQTQSFEIKHGVDGRDTVTNDDISSAVNTYLTTGNKLQNEVATQIAGVVANAPSDFDTLKEIADWITTHSESASAMNTQILANKASIEALQANSGGSSSSGSSSGSNGSNVIFDYTVNTSNSTEITVGNAFKDAAIGDVYIVIFGNSTGKTVVVDSSGNNISGSTESYIQLGGAYILKSSGRSGKYAMLVITHHNSDNQLIAVATTHDTQTTVYGDTGGLIQKSNETLKVTTSGYYFAQGTRVIIKKIG